MNTVELIFPYVTYQPASASQRTGIPGTRDMSEMLCNIFRVFVPYTYTYYLLRTRYDGTEAFLIENSLSVYSPAFILRYSRD